MSFAVPPSSSSQQGPTASAAAPATLDLPPSPGWRGAQIAGLVLWLVAISLVAVDVRRRRAEQPPRETVRPEWFVPLRTDQAARGGAGLARRRPIQGGLGAEDLEGEEMWIDV
jgi:hypothetical protein